MERPAATTHIVAVDHAVLVLILRECLLGFKSIPTVNIVPSLPTYRILSKTGKRPRTYMSRKPQGIRLFLKNQFVTKKIARFIWLTDASGKAAELISTMSEAPL
jgi:hypothetical protein